MTRRACLVGVVLFVAVTSGAPALRVAVAPPGPLDLAAHVLALTAPEMEGRGAGTAGGERAARYLVDRLRSAGLHPGGAGESFLQDLVIGSTVRLGPDSGLARLGAVSARFQAGHDWVPHGGSRRDTVSGELVFAGYGVSAADYDDYAGLDVRGRVVLVLEGAPPHRPGPPASRLEKVIGARRRGAAALLVAGEALPPLDDTSAFVNLVSGAVTRTTGDALIGPQGPTLSELSWRLANTRRPAPLATGIGVALRVDLRAAELRTANVIGVLRGRDEAQGAEAVVIGAHYDHLGRVAGTVYPGADDNASGTAVVVELARAFAAAGGASRTLVFVLFSAEEMGLLGSRHYVRAPAVPLERTVAMINFDMVGRLRDRPLGVGGVATGGGLRPMVERLARQVGVALADREAPGGASDHSPFYAAAVPVLAFHTGVHSDYHGPGDTADKIDAQGLSRVAAFAARLIEELATAPRPIYMALPEGSPRARQDPASRGGAFLGVSHARTPPSDGVRVGGVVPGSAAARAGMREGDIIVRFGDVPVESFEELRAALRARRPADAVQVVYLRDGEDHTARAILGEPP